MADQNKIIQRARDITGNKVHQGADETSVPDEAIVSDLQATVRELTAVFGSASTRKEVKFDAVPNQQDYAITTYVGSDVLQIEELMRSAHYVPEYILHNDLRHMHLGSAGEFNASSESAIPAGLQADVFENIVDLRRAQNYERFAIVQRGTVIRLMPPPVQAEVIAVTYISTSGGTISDLPTQTENALVCAAVVSILNGILNRLGQSRFAAQNYGQTDLTRMKSVMEQRKYYEARLKEELADLVA